MTTRNLLREMHEEISRALLRYDVGGPGSTREIHESLDRIEHLAHEARAAMKAEGRATKR